MFLKTIPLEFPEFGSDAVIFRPGLAYMYTAEAVQASSGSIDSVVVRRSEWPDRVEEIRRMASTWPTIAQPLIPQAAGAIGHYWPRESVVRLAVAESTSHVAEGRDAAVTGRLFLTDNAFTTESQDIAPAHLQLVDAVRGFIVELMSLPDLPGWEIEMCLSARGGLYFLQAQPSSAAFEDIWK